MNKTHKNSGNSFCFYYFSKKIATILVRRNRRRGQVAVLE